jgi:hypothetical protein
MALLDSSVGSSMLAPSHAKDGAVLLINERAGGHAAAHMRGAHVGLFEGRER